LFNPATGLQVQRRMSQLETRAAALGMTIEQGQVRDNAEIEKAIGALAQNSPAGFILAPDSFFNLPRTQLVIGLAARHRVPAVYSARDFVDAGGLASTALDYTDLQRRAALYVDHILKGATPAELPVQAPIKFEIVINRKTAKALDLVIPPKLAARTDEILD
jgi:putative tryptophan/tyrosine transport system substrate-binding protein